MQVKRIMTILRSGEDVFGYTYLEKIKDDIYAYFDAKCVGYDVVLRYNASLVDIMHVERQGKVKLRTYDEDIDRIEVGLFDDDSLIAYGTNCGSVDEESMRIAHDDYISANSENSDTYIEVNGDNADINSSSIKSHNEDITLEDGDSSSQIEADKEVKNNEDIYIMEKLEHSRDESSIYNEDRPFYKEIDSELEDIFARYEEENELEGLINSSKFAKIYYTESDYYVVGKILDEEGATTLICYGYPGEGGDNPPSEVEQNYDWVPLDKNNVKGRGYYMMYQNAVTGDVIGN